MFPGEKSSWAHLVAISYTKELNLPFLPMENNSALEGWGIELSTLGYGYVYESGMENCRLNQFGHDICVRQNCYIHMWSEFAYSALKWKKQTGIPQL